MSLVDRARFAHWTDLNEMAHIGIDSAALWRELEVLEGVEQIIPHLPYIGAVVWVRYCGMPREAKVTYLHVDGVSFSACIGGHQFGVFTVSDLIPAEQGGSAPE